MNNKSIWIGCGIVLVLLMLLVFGAVGIGMALFRAAPAQTVIVPTPEVFQVPPPVEAPPPTAVMQPTLPAEPPPREEIAPVEVNVENDLIALYDTYGPGVVSIQSFVVRNAGTGESSGSGFIINDEGLIVTNEHVIADSSRVIVIFFDGFAAEATVLGSDIDSDLAVLQVDELPDNVRALDLADSDEVSPGEWVIAIGNPFGLQNTITFGIVSAVGRMIPARIGSFSIPQAIQTDAAINPGNSGGPLLNLGGQVVGVNAQIRTDGVTAANVGVGFAIPSNIVRMVAPMLAQGEAYPWPWLGVSGTSLNVLMAEAGDLPDQRGAYIAEVVPNSPADRAGLRGSTQTQQLNGLAVPVGGDVIIQANGEAVLDFADLLEQVAFSLPGDEVDLIVLRDGEEIEITVTLERRPE